MRTQKLAAIVVMTVAGFFTSVRDRPRTQASSIFGIILAAFRLQIAGVIYWVSI